MEKLLENTFPKAIKIVSIKRITPVIQNIHPRHMNHSPISIFGFILCLIGNTL